MRFQQKTYLRPRGDVLSPLNPSEQFPGESTANGGSKTKPLDLDTPKNSDFSIFRTQNGRYNGRHRPNSLSFTRQEVGRHIRTIYIVSR